MAEVFRIYHALTLMEECFDLLGIDIVEPIWDEIWPKV